MGSSILFLLLKKLTIINQKKNAKTISTFDIRTLYTTVPHNLLIKFLSKIITFVFNYKKKTQVVFLESSVYWISRGIDKRFFTQQNLKHTV